jgi:hypothetical protein
MPPFFLDGGVKVISVGIYGGSGYTGQELLRLLTNHPDAKVVAVTSRRFAGVPVADVYPVFSGLSELVYTDVPPKRWPDLPISSFWPSPMVFPWNMRGFF